MIKPCLLSCFLFFFFFVFFIPQLSFSCPQDQRQSLLEFKNLLTNHSTAEIDLGRLQTWRPNSDCCKWQHVNCDARSPSREVIHLNLNSLVQSNLVSVSSSILRPVLRINSLVTLDISSNSIGGEIPGDAFVNLTRLISLDMSDNSFNGSIPPELFSLKTLQRLDLSWNVIGGTLSGDIKELKNLQELFLYDNLIGGEIPPEIDNPSEKLRQADLDFLILNGLEEISRKFRSVHHHSRDVKNAVELSRRTTDLKRDEWRNFHGGGWEEVTDEEAYGSDQMISQVTNSIDLD